MKKPFETWLVASDIHIPKENKAALDCWLQALSLLKPDGVILNGDIMDCGVFSRHDIFQPPKCHWTDSQFYDASAHDYKRMLQFQGVIDKLAPSADKIFNLGNHEVWLEDFINKSHKTRSKLFGFEERGIGRGWKINAYRKIFYLGKLRVVHTLFDSRTGGGGSGGKHHSAKHVETMGASVLYGHFHDIQTASKVTPEKNSHMAWCNGCLCDMNPDYLRNGPQNWSHGFSIVYLFPNGNFQVDLKRIVSGKVAIGGQLIDGNKGRFWK